MKPEQCNVCAYWQKPGAEGGGPFAVGPRGGECHRLPPRDSYRWPKTLGDSWCGEHAPSTAAKGSDTRRAKQ
jgi:hypothetical protein